MPRIAAVRGVSHVAVALLALVAVPAQAQVFRAYLSSTGNDANPCSLPAPCRLLPAALAAVADGGEIWMLDSANYNTSTVFVAKSVTLLAIPGAIGSIVATQGGHGLNFASANREVILRNLAIGPVAGVASGSGITVSATGVSIHIEQCTISRVEGDGILVAAAGAHVSITDSTLAHNGGAGLRVSSGSAEAMRVRSVRNQHGFLANPTGTNSAVLHVVDSLASRNFQNGVHAIAPTGASARVQVSRAMITRNNVGVYVAGDLNVVPSALIDVSSSSIVGNVTGLFGSGGRINSAGDNRSTLNTNADAGPISVTGSQ